jgi:precorrin-2 dehydrogenase / sirohydrochlorin ferrochelatase
MKVFPIYLNRLHDKKTVLIGGNHEAERKAGELLACDARLTVISVTLTDKLRHMAEDKLFTWLPRQYRPGDLEGAFMTIVAEFHGDINRQVYDEAEDRGILVNVMDDIPHCNFTFGSLVKRGALTLSVSTSGAAPALAVRLRERFEKEFGSEYAPFLEFMQQLRRPMAEFHTDFDARKRIWYELIDSDILDLFRQGQEEKAREMAAEIAGDHVVRHAMKLQNNQ